MYIQKLKALSALPFALVICTTILTSGMKQFYNGGVGRPIYLLELFYCTHL